MHPAPSIIIFSTLSGAGFGLIAFLSLFPLAASPWPTVLSAALAIGLCTAGLISSTFHLGRPERAWRALTQWRSSWLSREGILALATLTAFAGLVMLSLLRGGALPALGILPAALAGSSVYATGMIYASLRSVPTWHHPLTPWTYLAFSAATSAMLCLALALAFGSSGAGLLSGAALALLVIAWALKVAWWLSAARQRFGGSTPESATGLGPLGRVRLFEAPHTSPNYLMKEMVFRIGRKHAAVLRRLAFTLGGVLPALLIVGSIAAAGAWLLVACALTCHFAGLLAERWLFFAEAEHTVGLYYGQGQAVGRA